MPANKLPDKYNYLLKNLISDNDIKKIIIDTMSKTISLDDLDNIIAQTNSVKLISEILRKGCSNADDFLIHGLLRSQKRPALMILASKSMSSTPKNLIRDLLEHDPLAPESINGDCFFDNIFESFMTMDFDFIYQKDQVSWEKIVSSVISTIDSIDEYKEKLSYIDNRLDMAKDAIYIQSMFSKRQFNDRSENLTPVNFIMSSLSSAREKVLMTEVASAATNNSIVDCGFNGNNDKKRLL